MTPLVRQCPLDLRSSPNGVLITPTPIPMRTLHDYWFTSPDPHCDTPRFNMLLGIIGGSLVFLLPSYIISCIITYFIQKRRENKKNKHKKKPIS
jgi:hypothetical protein